MGGESRLHSAQRLSKGEHPIDHGDLWEHLPLRTQNSRSAFSAIFSLPHIEVQQLGQGRIAVELSGAAGTGGFEVVSTHSPMF